MVGKGSSLFLRLVLLLPGSDRGKLSILRRFSVSCYLASFLFLYNAVEQIESDTVEQEITE
jgi:hypothetical protein